MECGTKWTPMMPLEDAPQMKKLPDSSENSGARAARESTPPCRGTTRRRVRRVVPGSGAGLFSAAGSSSAP